MRHLLSVARSAAAIVHTPQLPASPPWDDEGFSSAGLRVYDCTPEHHHGIVSLRGNVVVYETDGICREGFIEDGGLYVIERQYPPASKPYEAWLRIEMKTASRLAQPYSRLSTSREVVRLIRHPRMANHWAYRLPSGFCDGPFADWAVALPMIGKVVGIYQP